MGRGSGNALICYLRKMDARTPFDDDGETPPDPKNRK